MTRTLMTVDQYHRLPIARKQAVDTWLVAHGLMHCHTIDGHDDGTVTVHEYRKNRRGQMYMRRGDVVSRKRKFTPTYPFPEDA